MSFTWSNLLSSKLGLCRNGKFSHMSARYDFSCLYSILSIYRLKREWGWGVRSGGGWGVGGWKVGGWGVGGWGVGAGCEGGECEYHSGWNTRMRPPMWPGVEYRSPESMQLVRGLSLLLVFSLSPRGFSPVSPVFPFPQKTKTNISNSNPMGKVSPVSWWL